MTHSIGNTVKTLREIRGLGQAELAALAGITAPNLCRIEADQSEPALSSLRALCEALNVGPGTLLGFSRAHPVECPHCHGQGFTWQKPKGGVTMRALPV